MNLHSIVNEIINQVIERKESLNNLKLHSLLYYTWVWSALEYGNNDEPMFKGDFEAWVHGPASPALFKLLYGSKNLYSEITLDDIDDSQEDIPQDAKIYIGEVLDVYGDWGATQLEIKSRSEKPWIEAREDLEDLAPCTNLIKLDTAISYYSKF